METRKTKSYTELLTIDNFIDRYNYLKLNGKVAEDTFGSYRYLNQLLYKSSDWKRVVREVKIRDEGCDLGVDDRIIGGPIYVHHMNPIKIDDILQRNPDVFNPEYLISCSFQTHNAIHYGDESLLITEPIVRRPNDTIPWR